MSIRLSWGRRKAAFHYPIAPAPRTAVLVDWFDPPTIRRRNLVRTFAEGWTPQAAAFAPAALAGRREQLLSLTSLPPRLTHALIVLARPGEPLTTASERDRLWRAFGVPVFEQIVAEDGRLLAAECEAHDGLHVQIAGRDWNYYFIETAPCGCGQSSPRLHAPEPMQSERAAAAYAQ